MKFDDLELEESLLTRLKEKGYDSPTEIQRETIPLISAEKEVIACAKTGSGKTLAFVLPMLHLILKNRQHKALIIVPTRELALQIYEDAAFFTEGSGLTSIVLFGGADYVKQKAQLKDSPEMIIVTPGRALDFLRSKDLDLSDVKYVVLDEADRMLDMGFIDDVKKLLKATSDDRVVSLFSATLDYSAFYSVWEFMKEPEEILINPELVDHTKITQQVYHLGRDEKLAYLVQYIQKSDHSPIIVFTNTKNFVENIVLSLQKHNIPAQGLSSTVSQNKRIRVLEDFKENKFRVLVATDVASRGLHVENIELVINYDIPQDPENYVHRIGRTARAGNSGTAISFCSELDYNDFGRVESYVKYKIPVVEPEEEILEKIDDTQVIETRRRDNRDNRGRDNRSRDRRPPRDSKRFQKNDARPVPGGNDRRPPARPASQKSFRNERRDDRSERKEESSIDRPYYSRSKKVSVDDIPDYPAVMKQEKQSLWAKITKIFQKKPVEVPVEVPEKTRPARKPQNRNSDRKPQANKSRNRSRNQGRKGKKPRPAPE